MKTLFFTVMFCTLSLSSQGGLKESFLEVAQQRKGPFGLNYLQGSSERLVVTNGRTPKGFLFQAAFRNELARALAEQEGFYVGNLFTTNYYELTGEFVYNDPYGSFPLDPATLSAQGPRAIAKAALMAQHWVLEKHYVEKFNSSPLARAFKIRGIAGSEFEQVFARHFFNFYLGAIDNDFQYLPAFLLVDQSPIRESKSLARARDLIAESYDYFLQVYGQNDARVKALYRLRNSIHNQLSSQVIAEIDAYLKNFPFYLEDGHTSLPEIRRVLVEYYSFNATKLLAQANSIGLTKLAAAASQVANQGVNASTPVGLAREAAALRGAIADLSVVAFERRTDALALLSDTSKFIGKEVQSVAKQDPKLAAETMVHAIYVEGFLIKDNWQYFVTESKQANPATLLGDVIEVAGGPTLDETFGKSLAQWKLIEPKMEYFLDNTIKSSALNAASALIETLRK